MDSTRGGTVPRSGNTTRIRAPKGLGPVFQALEVSLADAFGRVAKRRFYTALLAEYLQDPPARYWHHGNSSDVIFVEIDRVVANEIRENADVPLACFGFNAIDSFISDPLIRDAVYVRLRRSLKSSDTDVGVFIETHFRSHEIPLKGRPRSARLEQD